MQSGSGQQMLTLAPVYLACLCYSIALFQLLRHGRPNTLFRAVWTAGLAFHLIHVAAAFSYHHHWSHQAAMIETARQTHELFGVNWGGGLYFNYAFTLVWLADVAWMWKAAVTGRDYWTARRPPWTGTAIHAFLAFMFFNATAVFGHGWTRLAGIAAALLLAATALDTRRRSGLRR